jgi:protein-tyrosine-phosphatase
LFVCTGNTCRSPAAEVLARTLGPGDVEFGSAGTDARDGEPISPQIAAALPPDLDTSGFRSRRLTSTLLEGADLVLTMEAAHRVLVLDEDPALAGRVLTLGRLAELAGTVPEGLDREARLGYLGGAHGRADPALDVPDPYRRGAEAASGCVARLEELLRAVLPVLER